VARVAGDNALSNTVSAEQVARVAKDDVLSQAISVVSQALSASRRRRASRRMTRSASP
jgi:hypothetical protein